MTLSNSPANLRATTASDAVRLRVLAGTQHSRRGSVLVLVVGVLALLAIIIVVYTSVGQADVRGGRTLVNQARLDDQSRAIGEHIRSIIGEDASGVQVQRVYVGPNNPTYYSTRKTFDYPFTDPYARATLTAPGLTNPDYRRFNAAGNITKAWTAAGEDPRILGGAFLASTEPSWSNRELNRLPAMPSADALLALQRDWGHLSLISPSGLPVNLANLRGQFNAASGFTVTGPYSNSSAPAMSDWMYTWGHAANFAAAPGAPNSLSIDQYNSPATWSNDRLESFRPTGWNPSSLSSGDVKLLSNMFGDADGDGYLDSLWQELVDVSDPSRPSSLLPGGTGVRWFIAPRIVDLSALVNVNVATSFAVPPDAENPAGITPSDVDLERLLTMADARQYFGVRPGNEWMGGAAYNDPTRVTEAGRAAFAGILEARATGLAEVGGPFGNTYVDVCGPDIQTPPWLKAVGVQRPTGVSGSGVLLGSITRNQLYSLGGKDELTGQLRQDTTYGVFLKQNGGFGLGDERELRVFNGVNDSRYNSHLETVANADPRYALMSPLRSQRDIVTDRDAGSVLPAAYVGTGAAQVPASFAQYFTDVRHLLTTMSGSRPIRYSHLKLSGPNDPNIWYPMSDEDVRVDVGPLLRSAVRVDPDAAKGIYPLSAANELFINYSLALSPFLGDPTVWNDATTGRRALSMSFGGPTYKNATTGTDVGETDTAAFRGRAAELAVRTAAHMTLNLLAWQDNYKSGTGTQPDNRPLAATVLLDGSAAGRNNAATTGYTSGSRVFPYWQGLASRLSTASTLRPDTMGTGRSDFKSYIFDLDMGLPNTDSRLAGANGTNTMSTGYAINVFAAQPQPFITAAVSYDMYYDAPSGNGGDSRGSGAADRDGEWRPLDPNDPTAGTESLGVTIRGDVSDANSDFLMECVAFQVTNPFDVPITLGDPANLNAPTYYFEFAGKFYDARKYDDAGVAVGVVTLQPRQSVCFYVLNDTPARLLTRWRTAEPTLTTTAVHDWVDKQLTPLSSNQATPYRTVQIDPRTTAFTQVNPGVFNDPIASSATGNGNKVVRMWRVVRQNGVGSENATTNDVANDYLVDRLHDPDYGTGGRAALFRRLDPGNNRFTSIDSGPEPGDVPFYTGPSSQRDNTGFAITLYGSVRRRTDPDGGPLPGGTGESTAGVVPSWCMEPKTGGTFVTGTNVKNVTEANQGFPDTSSIAGVSRNDFVGKPASDNTLRRMINKGILQPAYTVMGIHPASRNQGNDAANIIGDDLNNVSWVNGRKSTQLPVYPRRAAAKPDNEVERPPLRPADLLMPWAIGPYQNPTVSGGSPEGDLELRHTTLSEAIAFGLNYSASTTPASYEFQIGKALDRCHLPTDRYAPFNDLNADGEFNYGNDKASVVNGVPFALNVLDRFRTTRYGSYNSMMAGLVNINTAPLSVLRMLPFLTPPSAHLYGNDNLGIKDHWMNNGGSAFKLKLVDDAGAASNRSLWKTSDERWDVAAVLAAYRDQQGVVVRGNQGDEAGGSRVYADFSPKNDTNRGGRAFMSNCVNVRPEPGIKSIGEIMLALVQDKSARTPAQTLDAQHQKQLGMDRMATDDNGNWPSNFQVHVTRISDPADTTLGVKEGTAPEREQAIGWTAQTSIRPATMGSGSHFVQGGKSSDYDRKVGIANALMNLVSTRSDVFCAYFLVNGYTEGDVQGLEPWTGTGAAPNEDRYTRPMTPSIQRRYMMVLDRSQCTRPGDKPKVLMFEEVPVR